MEELLAKTITVAVEIGLIKPEELKKVVVDSTVMPKAIAHPTDSKLLETSRDKLVEAARANGITLKQTFERKGKHLTHTASRYGHAKQYGRMRKVIKRHGTIIGRLITEVERKLASRRQAIEPNIGRPKSDHRLDRFYQVADVDDPAKRHQAFFGALFYPRTTTLV